MSNENNGRKKRVARQSWKPNHFLSALRTLWLGAYSVFKILAGAVATVLLMVIVCGFVFVGILATYLEEDIVPMADTLLEGFDLNQNSYAYYVDSDGDIQVLQKLYTTENREWATLDEIPEHLIHAAVAIEDKRFYEHQGVDWFTTIKACMNMFLGADSHFGGSSITQQLVKNLTGDDSVTVQRKVLEIFKATELERRYDKDTVLEWYLNWIYLGQRRSGVKAAAAVYFGKELEMLTAAECASLISITNNPSKYDPYRMTLDKEGKTGYEQNMIRKENTLTEMHELGWLTDEEYEEAMAQEIVLKWGIDDEDRMADCPNEACGYHNTVGTYEKRDDGFYYCPQCGTQTDVDVDASQEVYSYFMDTVLEDVCKAFAERDGVELTDDTMELYKILVSSGGYHIYTTFDAGVQESIDKIYTDLDEIPEDKSVQQLQSSIVIIDNNTGDIVGMAGGVGEKNIHDGLNRATDSELQPGSSMKPITVYGPAFEMGIIHPASMIDDFPLFFIDEETPFPRNSGLNYDYKLSVLSSIVWSVNSTAVQVLDKIGTSYSFDFAKNKLHLSGLTDGFEDANGKFHTDVDYAPLGLGAPTFGVSVRDMTAAYATYANNGIYREARTFTKVYDSEGNLVIDNTQDREQIFSRKTVDYMVYCMNQATVNGTGQNGQIPGHEVASKTGTTNDEKDRWYCGFTGQYTGVVWCGYDTPEPIIMVGDQSNAPGRLWKKVMEPIHEGLEDIPLYDRSKFSTIEVCVDCGNIAVDACHHDPRNFAGYGRTEWIKVYEEDIPLEVCECHMEVEFCGESNCVANEYCEKFAKAGEIELLDRSVVKLTQDMVDKLRESFNFGLQSYFQADNWIYLIDENGKPGSFIGINGDINEDIDAPYQVCTEHTKEAWEKYLEEHEQTDEEPDDNKKPGTDTKPEDNKNPNTETEPEDDRKPNTETKPEDNTRNPLE